MSSKVQLTGGAFQDSEGNVLANGYLLLKLSQDASVVSTGNICSGVEIKIQLDGSGNVVVSPAQSVWGNDVLTPSNTFYRVTGYTAKGQPAWGPNNQQIIGTGTFDLGTWIPNTVFSWTPAIQSLLLQTNGTNNPNQLVENLRAGTGVTLATDTGGTTISTSGGGGLPLPDVARYVLWMPGDTSKNILPQNDNLSSIDSGSTSSFDAPTSSAAYQLTLTGNRLFYGIPQFYAGRNFTFIAQAGLSNGDNFAHQAVGMIDGVAWFGNPLTGSFISFVASSTGTWLAQCSNGASTTSVDSGAFTNILHILEIIYTPTSVVFKIDGTTVATITTNIPSTAVIFPMFYNHRASLTTQTLSLVSLYVTQVQP